MIESTFFCPYGMPANPKQISERTNKTQMPNISIKDALNKVYMRQKPKTADFNQFCEQLEILKKNIANGKEKKESEEHIKNHIIDFLNDSFYKKTNLVNTKERIDCAIYETRDSNSPVQVLIEVKRPGSNEFPSLKNLNSKAMQEAILYYLRERIKEKNIDLKHIVVTNGEEWFVFDAADFEKLFMSNKDLVKYYKDFEINPTLFSEKTSMFYDEIASPVIDNVKSDLPFAYFDLRLMKSDQQKVQIYKLLSPEHLLRKFVCNDSNELNTPFYNELLYILGLEEVEDGGKKKICRLTVNRQQASFVENAINLIEDDVHIESKQFEIALSLTITWINRILFLKLLEAQLVNYHKGDRDYCFLNIEKIKGFDDLQQLFFKVLAVPTNERKPDVAVKYCNVPYLNSSLFETAEYESSYRISGLRDDNLPIHKQTILRNSRNSKRLDGELPVLEYLFRFLDAYDFGSEPNNDLLTRDDRKTLINASVLGLIFEKINGYKDGSFFTPGFITSYMCRETIRRTVVQKFNDAKGWQCQSFDELYDKDFERDEANQIINSIRICDPAVGSGHFLVSALNELIAIKSDLQILQRTDGRRLKNKIIIENDELMVYDEDGEPFVYNPKNEESLLVQQSLFEEKRAIIENCLFGVDINPNSVNICRLRLWIELLKNAYYKADGEFETLPNIDINIKCGNSLVSYYPVKIGEPISKDDNLASEIKKYKASVKAYKYENNKIQKQIVNKAINEIKRKLTPGIQLRLELENADIVENKRNAEMNIYRNSMEWMIEFPEVLDEKGRFLGFDVVIGNPPYIKEYDNKSAFDGFREKSPYYVGKMDLWHGFACFGLDLTKPNGYLNFIAQNNWTTNGGAALMREKIRKDAVIVQMLDFFDYMIFKSESGEGKQKSAGASIQTMVMLFQRNANTDNYSIDFRTIIEGSQKTKKTDVVDLLNNTNTTKNEIYTPVFNRNNYKNKSFTFSTNEEILDKIADNKVYLQENEATNGIHTHHDCVTKKIHTEFPDLEIGRAIFVLTTQNLNNLQLEDKEKSLIKPYFSSDEIMRYYTIPENKNWIIYTGSEYKSEHSLDNMPHLKQHLDAVRKAITSDNKPYGLHRAREVRFFKGEKIVSLRKCVDKPCFSYSDFDCYVPAMYYVIKTSRWNMKFLTGILNSSLIAYWLRKKGKMQGSNYQVDKEPLKNIPLPLVTTDQQQPIIDLVEQILAAKKQDTQADTSELEKKIDLLVYHLYNLTYDEAKMIDETITEEDFTAAK